MILWCTLLHSSLNDVFFSWHPRLSLFLSLRTTNVLCLSTGRTVLLCRVIINYEAIARTPRPIKKKKKLRFPVFIYQLCVFSKKVQIACKKIRKKVDLRHEKKTNKKKSIIRSVNKHWFHNSPFVVYCTILKAFNEYEFKKKTLHVYTWSDRNMEIIIDRKSRAIKTWFRVLNACPKWKKRYDLLLN